MKFDMIKEHKRYFVWVVVVLLLVAIAWAVHEFREKREWHYSKEWRGSYERTYRWENSRFEWQEWGFRGEKWGFQRGGGMMNNRWENFQGIEKGINKVNLPLNMVSEADVTKTVLDANSWAKVVSVALESIAWNVDYSFVLDNKAIVKVDAVSWKVITKAPAAPTTGTGISK